MNISATLNAFKLLIRPSLCLPQSTISTFNDLPIPISKVFGSVNTGDEPDIKAVILDKDDCFAVPHANVIYKPYVDKFHALRAAYPGSRLMIVSNSAGTHDDAHNREAFALERATGVKVLEHRTKKPGCGTQIIEYLRNQPNTRAIQPSQVAIIGDRLSTDIMMANMSGFWGIWVKEGVVREKSLISRLERRLPDLLTRYGLTAPKP